jgi:hypothetical protein
MRTLRFMDIEKRRALAIHCLADEAMTSVQLAALDFACRRSTLGETKTGVPGSASRSIGQRLRLFGVVTRRAWTRCRSPSRLTPRGPRGVPICRTDHGQGAVTEEHGGPVAPSFAARVRTLAVSHETRTPATAAVWRTRGPSRLPPALSLVVSCAASARARRRRARPPQGMRRSPGAAARKPGSRL